MPHAIQLNGFDLTIFVIYMFLAVGLGFLVSIGRKKTTRGYFLGGNVPPAALAGSVGPRRTITLKPKSALPGPAMIVVNDRSARDNFHLSGPGLNKKTGVRTRGRVTWNVTLAPGLYTYRSDRTKKLRGTLTVKFPA